MKLSRTKVVDAIFDVFTDQHPKVFLVDKNRVKKIEDNLLDGVCRCYFEAELRTGGGGELKLRSNETQPRFHSIHSSSALAVNCFAPFKCHLSDKNHLSDLSILGENEFDRITFEEKCPVFDDPKKSPPNLDLVIKNEHKIIAIESKLTEYLGSRRPKFSETYNKKIKDERRDGKWFKEMKRLTENTNASTSYTHLDAAQLIKHALGLAHTFPNHSIVLLYLYWEPKNARDYETIKTHRNEIKKFKARIAGDALSFETMTYHQLWQDWENNNPQPWLQQHIRNLRLRYDINV